MNMVYKPKQAILSYFFRNKSVKCIIGIEYHYFTYFSGCCFLLYNLLNNSRFTVFTGVSTLISLRYSRAACPPDGFIAVFENKSGCVDI